ncbi:MAG TPA: LysM peptidoglycan-binding domain-containing protein [Bacteroidia bacterium]|nr:LysM peptidoglycan-binding domain-containing protein [Bacteroidia bacterium]
MGLFPHNDKKLFIITMLVMMIGFSFPLHAQNDGGVKKSAKTEIVDGKKYYLHKVEKGQTLYAIAKAYDLTVNDIIVENPDAMNGIHPGQVLRIPFEKPKPVATAASSSDSTFVIKVQQGQTLYSIAHQYNTTEDAILKLNPDAKGGLKTGQDLRIPGKKKEPVLPALVGNENPSQADTLYNGKKKDSYNIAFMLPLQLWNVDNINPGDPQPSIPQKAQASVDFYEGALIAIDSMKRRGMNVHVYVYDTDDADSAKVQSILSKPEFSEMDMIIGPLSPGPFYPVSEWAKAHNVPVISPVSPANRVLFKRPEALKALPGISTQMEGAADYLAAAHPKDNIILFNSGNTKDNAAAGAFSDRMNQLLFPSGNDSIRSVKSFSAIGQNMKIDKLNIVVIPSQNQAFVSDLLRQLNGLTDKYSIMVFGMSFWMSYDLDPEYLEKLQVHFPTAYYVDYDSSASVQRFVKRYQAVYNGDPSMYAFAGYDVTMFFLNAMFTYGTDFYRKREALKGTGLQQDFDFVRSDEESGFENNGVRIVGVKDYHLFLEKQQ